MLWYQNYLWYQTLLSSGHTVKISSSRTYSSGKFTFWGGVLSIWKGAGCNSIKKKRSPSFQEISRNGELWGPYCVISVESGYLQQTTLVGIFLYKFYYLKEYSFSVFERRSILFEWNLIAKKLDVSEVRNALNTSIFWAIYHCKGFHWQSWIMQTTIQNVFIVQNGRRSIDFYMIQKSVLVKENFGVNVWWLESTT